MLESGILEHIFSILDWAVQVLLAYDNDPTTKKLLLHQQVLHECILAPMNLISVLISGEFLKRGELRCYLQPNEMSANVAILKLKLAMMKNLYQPMIEFFIERKAAQFLLIADKYDHDFSKLMEGVYCVLCANAFFGHGSTFDPENLKQIRAILEKKTQTGSNRPANPIFLGDQNDISDAQKLTDMGFDPHDVASALSMCRFDFERALDHLCRLGTDRE